MKIEQLASEYKRQADNLYTKIQQLEEKRTKCKGKELYDMNRKITVLKDMQSECITTYYQLLHYYDET